MRNAAENLATTCKKANVSLRDVCRCVGWTNAMLHKWRTGEAVPMSGNLILLAAVANIIEREMAEGRLPVELKFGKVHRRKTTEIKLRQALQKAGLYVGEAVEPPMEG